MFRDSGLKVVVVELAQRRSLAVALFEITPQTPIHGTADIVDFPDRAFALDGEGYGLRVGLPPSGITVSFATTIAESAVWVVICVAWSCMDFSA